jgi:MurNAc alpha-1-phosphate uridylyltransferase
LVLVPNPPQHAQGDFSLAGDRVIERSGPTATYSGVAVFAPEFFVACSPGPFKLLPLLLAAIGAGRLSGELYSGEWFDIGTPQRLAELDASLRSR